MRQGSSQRGGWIGYQVYGYAKANPKKKVEVGRPFHSRNAADTLRELCLDSGIYNEVWVLEKVRVVRE